LIVELDDLQPRLGAIEIGVIVQEVQSSPRQNYLYLSAELTRPCLAETNFTSNHAPQRQDEVSTRGKPPYANLRGYDERYGRLTSALR
jgi:hypothetical protein